MRRAYSLSVSFFVFVSCVAIMQSCAPEQAVFDMTFTETQIPGITDDPTPTDGVALVDLNRDGLVDVFKVSQGEFIVFLNQGGMQFEKHQLTVYTSDMSRQRRNFGRAQIPNLVDFNRDGFLDVFITRNRGTVDAPTDGNILLISQGRFDVFREISESMGVRNATAYNRQSAIGDVNQDGWLDIAVGSDNIGNTRRLGLPISRLYVFQPDGPYFEDGRFQDIGGTDLVPDFGGEFTGNPDYDRAGPGIVLRDLDNDNDLDLIQGYHCDMHRSKGSDPYASGEYLFGVFCWKNMISETGHFYFERIEENGLAEWGRMDYDERRDRYTVEKHSVGLPYVFTADTNNNGMQDVLAIGPTDRLWHVHSDQVAGKFWNNIGTFQFTEQTRERGLTSLNWPYWRWSVFNRLSVPFWLWGWQFYMGDAVFADFDNDTFLDFVLVDRHEFASAPNGVVNVLYMNDRGTSFSPIPMRQSGLKSSSICAETADFNNDGLMDLYFVGDPANSWGTQDGWPISSHFTDRVFLNAGSGSEEAYRWIKIKITGVSDHELVGTRVTLYGADSTDGDDIQCIGSREVCSSLSYKSGNSLELHFGLAMYKVVFCEIEYPSGTKERFRVSEFNTVLKHRFLATRE